MLLQAAKEFDLDLANCIFVGDKESNIQAEFNAGVGCNILYCSPYVPITACSFDNFIRVQQLMEASVYLSW